MRYDVFRKGAIGVFFLGLILILSGIAYAQDWAQTYGGINHDYAYSIQQTSDGGYIVAGETGSSGAGGSDFWVLKFKNNGDVAWQKTYGGTSWDYALSIQQTSDGGYIVAGGTESFGAGGYDFWVLKLDGSGNVDWQKTYGGPNYDSVESIQQTSDGGYIVAGMTESFGAGSVDAWVLKLKNNGDVDWQKTYGGTGSDWASSIQQTPDGYIVAGRTQSSGAGGYDAWVLKLKSDGNVDWQKTYGGTSSDSAHSIQQTSDGGYIVAGYTDSFGAGNGDAWVLKLDGSGNVDWQKTYGGTSSDSASSIQQTSDGGYIVTGETYSFGAGYSDFWVLKLDGSGNVTWQKTYGGTDYDYAYSIQQTSDGGYIVAGYTYSFGAGGSDVWVMKLDGSGEIPDCSPMGTSNATVNNTGVAGSNSAAIPGNTGVTAGISTATPADTHITPAQQCYYAPAPAPGSAPPAIGIHANGERYYDEIAVLNPVDLSYDISNFWITETCKEMFLILNAPLIGVNWSYLNAQGQWIPVPQELGQVTPFGCAPGNGRFTLYQGDLPVGDYEIYMGIDLIKNGHLDLYNNNLIYDHLLIHVVQ